MAQLKKATMLAKRRGSKLVSVVDVVFQIRHNTAKVSRLKSFLSWKDVRKNVNDSDDKGGGDADAIDLEEVSTTSLR
jgi:transcription initiation protein SPT3